MAQKYGTERTGRTMPCNVCGKLYTDNIDESAKEITCPYCIMKGGIKKSNSEIKTTNLKEKIMPTNQGRIKPTDFTSSFKKYVNGIAETITINQHKTWKEMIKEVLGTDVYEKNKHASMYLVYKKYLDKNNDPNLYLEKIGEDPAEVTRTPEPVVETAPPDEVPRDKVKPEGSLDGKVTIESDAADERLTVEEQFGEEEGKKPAEPTEPEPTVTEEIERDEPEVTEDFERDEEGNIVNRDEEGNIVDRPETTQPVLTESDVTNADSGNTDGGDINGSEIGGDTGIDADKNE